MVGFFREQWPEILKGLGVLAVFLVIKYFSFDREPKKRANGVPYGQRVGNQGPENHWDAAG